MISSKITRRYALALMELAEEQKQVDRIVQDMELLQQAARESKDFVLFLKSPVVKKEKKKSVIKELFQNKLSSLSLDFLMLLCEKGREEILRQLIIQFFVLRDERLGIVTVDVKAATELSKDQVDQIQKRFEGITKKRVRLSFNLDTHLKGGFIARVGDTVFDGSVRRQLERMREHFLDVAHN
jgi:F-type H+-transporting ATPase subunit delta